MLRKKVFSRIILEITISIHTSDQGTEGTKISIHRAALLSALTITNDADKDSAVFSGTGGTKHTGTGAAQAGNGDIVSFAAATSTDSWDLADVSMGVLKKHLKM